MGNLVGGIIGGLFGGLGALVTGESVVAGVVTGVVTGGAVGLICDSVTTGGVAPVVGVFLIGVASATGNWTNQSWNNYEENKKTSSKNFELETDSFKENITKSISDVNYKEVTKAALTGMAFTPMSYGTNKLLISAFSGLENNFVNKTAEFIAGGFLEFNNAGIQFIIDLF